MSPRLTRHNLINQITIKVIQECPTMPSHDSQGLKDVSFNAPKHDTSNKIKLKLLINLILNNIFYKNLNVYVKTSWVLSYLKYIYP